VLVDNKCEQEIWSDVPVMHSIVIISWCMGLRAPVSKHTIVLYVQCLHEVYMQFAAQAAASASTAQQAAAAAHRTGRTLSAVSVYMCLQTIFMHAKYIKMTKPEPLT